MDDVMNRIAKELSDAIAAAVAEDARLEACREKARAAGFELKISLEAVIGFVSRNQPGTLAQVAQVIGEHGGNIDNVHMDRPSQDFTQITIDLGVYDLKHLNAIIEQLRAKPVVSSAERFNG